MCCIDEILTRFTKEPLIVPQIALLVCGTIISLYGFFTNTIALEIPGALIMMILIALNIVSRKKQDNDMSILKHRLAKGEISKEEFDDLKKSL